MKPVMRGKVWGVLEGERCGVWQDAFPDLHGFLLKMTQSRQIRIDVRSFIVIRLLFLDKSLIDARHPLWNDQTQKSGLIGLISPICQLPRLIKGSSGYLCQFQWRGSRFEGAIVNETPSIVESQSALDLPTIPVCRSTMAATKCAAKFVQNTSNYTEAGSE